ncbi:MULTISPECIES: hypothetical protein [unclassified Pseudomonas]|uniref:hypothetical protein n=1 Tax=unclassified Pseudomonas TaxID=196821 RepID=UPI0015C0C4F8|nr:MULTISPECIES: hypothetical protein [unclassified Pseudomonas]MCS4249138.1 hypothetical protein [Pseudomonas sp. BIGb0164]NWE20927.1 hypothetical protein [Pseudomonas sp. P7548]
MIALNKASSGGLIRFRPPNNTTPSVGGRLAGDEARKVSARLKDAIAGKPGPYNGLRTAHLHLLLVQDLRNSFVVSVTNKSKKMPRSRDRGIFL